LLQERLNCDVTNHQLCCAAAGVLAAQRWGYQDLQPWQDALIQRAEEGPLALLKQQLQQRVSN
jgi:hypothetical protein